MIVEHYNIENVRLKAQLKEREKDYRQTLHTLTQALEKAHSEIDELKEHIRQLEGQQ